MKSQKKSSHMVRNVLDFCLKIDVLPGSYCKELINIFENSSHQEFINDDHKPCFTQVNLNKEKIEMVREMIPIVKGVRQMYQVDTKSRKVLLNSKK